MWKAIWELLARFWNGPPQQIEPVIAGYGGLLREWRRLYDGQAQKINELEQRIEECEEDRADLRERVETLEKKV